MKFEINNILKSFHFRVKGCGALFSYSPVFISLLALAFSIQMPLHAQQDLDAYAVMAVENNPGIQASFQRYRIALEKVNQAGNLQDPEINLGFFLRPMELLMGNQRGQASVMQMFPWFGMLNTQKSEATKMAEAAYESFRSDRNQLQLQVKEIYYQLQQLNFVLDITNSNLELLRYLESLAISRFQGGNTSVVPLVSNPVSAPRQERSGSTGGMAMGGTSSGSSASSSMSPTNSMSAMGESASSGRLTDVLRLQVQILGLESELLQLEENRKPLEARLNQLLGRASNTPVAIQPLVEFAPMDLDVESLLDSIQMHNPMLLMLEREGEAYRIQGKMARLEGKPMIGLGVEYMVFSPRSEDGMIGHAEMPYMPAGMGNNMVMPMVTMTLPIYRKKYRSAQAEAEIWRNATALQKESLELQLTADFETVIRDIRDAERKVTLYKEQLELLERTLEIATTAYSTGDGTFEEVLGIQRELLDYRLNMLNARIDQLLSRAQLETLIGI
jgi:outer membrane protein TolC